MTRQRNHGKFSALVARWMSLMVAAIGSCLVLAGATLADEPCATEGGACASGSSCDPRIYVGGNFNGVGSHFAAGVGRWGDGHWTNLVDPAFDVPFLVEDIVSYGGSYYAVGNGSLWQWTGGTWAQSLGSGTAGCAAVFNGNLVVGGTSLAGTTLTVNCNNQQVDPALAQWNGSTWSLLGLPTDVPCCNGNPNCAPSVFDIIVLGDDLFITGTFTHIGNLECNGIARWNGSTGSWQNLGAGIREPGDPSYAMPQGRALAIYDPDGNGPGLVVMGRIGRVNGYGPEGFDVNHITFWRDGEWSNYFVPGFPDATEVWCAVQHGNQLFAGPWGWGVSGISKWDPTTSSWSRVNGDFFAYLAGGAGAYPPSFRSMTVFNDKVHVGGGFSAVGTEGWTSASRNVAYCKVDPYPVISVRPLNQLDEPVHTLEMYNGDLHAGGAFNGPAQPPPTVFEHVAKWTGSWVRLSNPEEHGPNGIVRAMKALGNALYMGGDFTTAGDLPPDGAFHLARWTGEDYQGFGGVDGPGTVTVYALESWADELYVGGSFTTAGTLEIANGIAKYNPVTDQWSELGDGVTCASCGDAKVRAIMPFGGSLYVGGVFDTAGAVQVHNIAKWHPSTGWCSVEENIEIVGEVRCMEVYAGSLYIGGDFTVTGITGAKNLLRLDGSSLDWHIVDNSPPDNQPVLPVDAMEVYDAGDGDGEQLYVDHSMMFTCGGGGPGGGGGGPGGGYGFGPETDCPMTVIRRWNGNAGWWWPGGTFVNGDVLAMRAGVSFNGEYVLNIGGDFLGAGGASSNSIPIMNLAQYDEVSETWLPVGGGVGYGGQMFVGGAGGNIQKLRVFNEGQQEALYAVGAFDVTSDVYSRGVAELRADHFAPLGGGLHGVVDQTFGEHTYVHDMVEFDDGSGMALYVTGCFTKAVNIEPDQTLTPVGTNGVARWDGSMWSPVGEGGQAFQPNACGFEFVVHTEQLTGAQPPEVAPHTELYVVGDDVDVVKRWNGSVWQDLGFPEGVLSPSTGGSLLSHDGVLYVGGPPAEGGSLIVRRDPSNGTWQPVSGLIEDDWRGMTAFLGGIYVLVNAGDDDSSVWRFDPGNWQSPPVPVGNLTGPGMLNGLSVVKGENGGDLHLYAFGDFKVNGGSIDNRVVRFDGANWEVVIDATSLAPGWDLAVGAPRIGQWPFLMGGFGDNVNVPGTGLVYATGLIQKASELAPWAQPATGGTNLKVTDLLVLPKTELKFERNRITPCDWTVAELVPPPLATSINWSVDKPEMVDWVKLDKYRIKLIAKGERGNVKVTATASNASQEKWEQLLVIKGDCSSCSEEAGSPPGSAEVSLDGVDVNFSMGTNPDGKLVGAIVLHADQPSADLASPKGLAFPVLTPAPIPTVDTMPYVVYDQCCRLEQVLSEQALAVIEVINESKYEIRFYAFADKGQRNPVTGRYSPSQGSEFVKWEISGDVPTQVNCVWRKLTIKRFVGSVHTATFVYDSQVDDQWTLETIDPTPMEPLTLRLETSTWTGTPGLERNRDYTLKNNVGQVVYHVDETYQTLNFEHPGNSDVHIPKEVLTTSVVDPGSGGAALVTDRYYYLGSGEKSGKIKAEAYPDGSWAWYDYDPEGRMTVMLRPWKDTSLGDPESDPPSEDIRKTTYSYEPDPLAPLDDGSREPNMPRMVKEEIILSSGSSVVSLTFFAYYVVNGNRVDIQKRAVSPTAEYDDSTNLVTTTVRLGSDPLGEKLVSVQYPDGRLDEYFYAKGTYDDLGAEPIFTVGAPDAPFERTIVYHNIASSQDISAVDTSSTSVTNQHGAVVMSETYKGNLETRLSWTRHEYDNRGRQTLTASSDGTQSQTIWSCCNVESRIDENGIQTNYTHNILGGVITETKTGVALDGSYPAQLPIVTRYGYDAAGRVIDTWFGDGDPNVLHTSREYNKAGQLTDEWDAAGLQTEYLYENLPTSGRKVTVTRPGGFTEITESFRDGRVKTTYGTAVVTQAYEYGINASGDGEWTQSFTGSAGTASPRWNKAIVNVAGNVIREERPAYPSGTFATIREYDDRGRLSKVTTDPATAATVSIYGDNASLSVNDYPDRVVRSGVDLDDTAGLQPGSNDGQGFKADRLTETRRSYSPDGGAWWLETQTFTYPKAGDATPVLLSKTRTQLTGLGTTGTDDFTLVSLSKSWDIHENLTVSKSEIKRATRYSRQTVDTPDSATSAVSLTRNGLLQESTSTTGLKTTYFYDSIARRTVTIDARGVKVTTEYEPGTGRVWKTTTNDDHDVTTYEYDQQTGRLKSVTNPTTTKKTRYEYTDRGETWRVWGDVPQPVEMGYDAYGQRTTLSTYRTGTTWNQANWPGGSPDTTTWIFDAATGLLTRKLYADGNLTDYTHTFDGKLYERKWSRQSLKTTYAYDAKSRELTSIEYSDTTPRVSFAYNRLGAVATAAAAAITTHTFAYDDTPPGGKLHLQTESITGLHDRIITREYDATAGAVGRPAGFKVAAGGSTEYDVDYGYDSLGRFGSVKGPGLTPGGAVYSFVTNSDMVSTINFMNGVNTVASTTRAYEPYRDLIDFVENKSGGTTVSKYDYTNDNLARRTRNQMTGTAFDPPPNNPRYVDFEYNDRHELTASRRYNGVPGSGTLVASQQYLFGYDPIGNRSWYSGDAQGGARQYNTNNLNQYTTTISPAETFIHDADGNLAQDGSAYYTWDAENRLIEVEPKPPLTTASRKLRFAYDYMGRRVRKQAFAWNGSSWNGTPSLHRLFVYDGWNVVEELDVPSGVGPITVARKYTWGLDLGGQTSGLSGVSGIHAAGGVGGLLGMNVPATSANYVYFYDGNGNVGQLINAATGAVDAKYEYYPYGGELVTSGAAAGLNFFRFSTKYLDTESRAYYYGYRYHMPKHGRWLSRDLLEEFADVNLYRTLSNSPIMLIDKFGLTPSLNGPGPAFPYKIGVKKSCSINQVYAPGNRPRIQRYFFNAVARSWIELGAVGVSGMASPVPNQLAWDPTIINSGPTISGAIVIELLWRTLIKDNGNSPTDDSHYRLYTTSLIEWQCCNGSIVAADMSITARGGAEGLTTPEPGFIDKTRLDCVKECAIFAYRFRGRPARLAEVIHSLVGIRNAKYIWHYVEGEVCCKNSKGENQGEVRNLRFKGSAFPSHRLWANGKLMYDIPQGLVNNLWISDPTDPVIVK